MTVQELKENASSKSLRVLEKLESLIRHCAGAQREVKSFESVVDADKEEMLVLMPQLGISNLSVPGAGKAVHVGGTQVRLDKTLLVSALRDEGVSQKKIERILLASHKSYPQNYIRFGLEGEVN